MLLDLLLEDARNVREPGDTSLMASFKTLNRAHRRLHLYQESQPCDPCGEPDRAELTGSAKDPSELVGKTDYDIHPEEIADIGYRLEKQAIAEGRRVNQFQQLTAQDGTKRWIDNRKYPINGPAGEIIGIFGVAPDITQYIEAG